MAITGNISQIPISDMIQSLSNSRRSGNLWMCCAKKECSLVFSHGEIISANYLNSLVRIGQVLIRIGAISKPELSWALAIQEQDINNRKPLVLTLVEGHMAEKEAAYNGLNMLIEMTLNEVLSWIHGYYEFEECNVDNPDGYGWHYHAVTQQDVSQNVQSAH